MGDGAQFETTGVNDARVALGSWTQATYSSGVNNSIGGQMFTSATNASGPMTFKPTDPVNSFKIWYLDTTGASSFAISIGQGAYTTVTSGNTGTVLSTTITGGVAVNTLNLKWLSVLHSRNRGV